MTKKSAPYTTLEHITKRMPTNTLFWMKADAGTLLENISLICGEDPNNASDDVKNLLEHEEKLTIYSLAIRSIESGNLKAKKTGSGYLIGIDDFLRWAMEKEMGDLLLAASFLRVRKEMRNDIHNSIAKKLPKTTEKSPEIASTPEATLLTKKEKLSYPAQMKAKAKAAILEFRREKPRVSNEQLVVRLGLIKKYKQKTGKEYSKKFWINYARSLDETSLDARRKRKRQYFK